MPTNYVLVDFENVQPDSLAALATGQFRVKVFVGASQAKGRISFELVHSMQALGANAEYVKIARTGKNAVDMHIAYYVGRLLEKEPNAVIHIVSRDSDFDPLIEYLDAKDRTSVTVPAVKSDGWSVWVVPRFLALAEGKPGLEGLFRYDSLRPDENVDARRHRLIVGLAYWFPLRRGPSAALLLDMDRATFDPPLDRPTDRRYSLHALFNY